LVERSGAIKQNLSIRRVKIGYKYLKDKVGLSPMKRVIFSSSVSLNSKICPLLARKKAISVSELQAAFGMFASQSIQP
jgi:hypothetical protein